MSDPELAHRRATMAQRPLPDWPRGMPEWMAAKYIGLSISSLHTLVDDGEIVATWVTSGRKVYLRERLDAFLDRRDRAGNADPTPADDVPDWQRALMADGQGDAAVR